MKFSDFFKFAPASHKGYREFMLGKEDSFKKLPTMNQGQQSLFSNLLNMLNGGQGDQMGQGGQGGGQGALAQAMGLSQGFLDPNSEQYKNFEAPYMNQFEQQIMPMIAERFAGMGGGMGGGLSSSGFGQALGGAGAGLQAQLAGMKGQMQRQSIGDILGMTQFGLQQQPFAYGHQQASPGFLPQLFGAGAKAFTGGMGGY